jgi:hypothetical protein
MLFLLAYLIPLVPNFIMLIFRIPIIFTLKKKGHTH